MQPFAEPHAIRQQKGVIQRRLRKEVCPAHLGPELPHAAGDPIRVVIQFLIRAQRHERLGRRAGETAQVQFLPAGDRIEHLAHKPRISGRQPAQQRQARLAFLQQHALSARRLPPRQGAKIQRRVPPPLNPLAQGLQSLQPLLRRHQLGVGDGVRRAREQIGQPNGRTHLPRQHAQRQIERARNLLQQTAQ